MNVSREFKPDWEATKFDVENALSYCLRVSLCRDQLSTHLANAALEVGLNLGAGGLIDFNAVRNMLTKDKVVVKVVVLTGRASE